jgi:hypothetical protein
MVDATGIDRQNAGIHIAESLTTGSQPQALLEAEFSLNESGWSL